MSAPVADSSTPHADYEQSFDQGGTGAREQEATKVTAGIGNTTSPTVKMGTSPFSRLKRAWFTLRWKLAASIFSRSVPFLTASLDLKLGDVMITLPVAAAALAWNAWLCAQQKVEESGSLPTLTMLGVFALTVRNPSILLSLTGLPYERALLYHKFFGGVAVLLSGLHGLAYLLEEAGVAAARRERRRLSGRHSESVFKLEDSLSGAILFYLLVALSVFAFFKIRRAFYEFFLRMHWLLFLAIIPFALMHGAGGMLFGFIPWVADLIFRHGILVPKYYRGGLLSVFRGKRQSQDAAKPGSRLGVISQEQLQLCRLSGGILRIQFPRVRDDTGETFKYEAGQYVFICVPKLGYLEWHPFTISSAPHEALVTIHIKALGDWTRKLLDEVSASSDGQEQLVASPFAILMDGPYGSSSVDIETKSTYAHFALFSGGIGITPMQAIANQLHFDFHHRGRSSLKKVHFIWAVRERSMVEAMMSCDFVEARKHMPHHVEAYLPDALLSSGLRGGSTSPNDVFKAEFFLTRGHPDLENPVESSLRHCLRYNTRPDVAETLRVLGQDAKKNGNTQVAVLVCGPAALVSDVVRQSLKLERELKVRFDVHTENFDF